MNLDTQKIPALVQIYSLFDSMAESWSNACEKGCSVCCSNHLTMTTLEGAAIINYLEETQNTGLLDRLKNLSQNVFAPVITLNGLAECCIGHKEPPDEPKPKKTLVCPFLDKDTCPIYLVRPMGCRIMFSTKKCKPNTWSDMEELWLTASQVFFQIVEGLDCPGFFGNMAHVLKFLQTGAGEEILLENQAVPGLIVPKEHREPLAPVIADLNMILAKATR